MKREAQLKRLFTQELHRQLPRFIMLLQATAGAPDRAIVGNGITSLWEFKHATPQFESPGNQELMCMRLAEQGYCRYVVWWETKELGQQTMIVTPKAVHERKGGKLTPEAWCEGFNHRWLVAYIKQVHGV